MFSIEASYLFLLSLPVFGVAHMRIQFVNARFSKNLEKKCYSLYALVSEVKEGKRKTEHMQRDRSTGFHPDSRRHFRPYLLKQPLFIRNKIIFIV